MATTGRNFKLGLFVLAGLALIVAGVVVFGGGALFRPYFVAETLVDESVSGLEVGAPVKHRGVTIGKVSWIGFAGREYPELAQRANGAIGQYILIRMHINTDALSPVSEADAQTMIQKMVEDGLRLRLSQAGITGPVYLEADYFNPKTFPPPDLPIHHKVVYVPSAPSVYTRAMKGLEKILADIQESNIPSVVGHFDKLLVDANKAVNDLQVAEVRTKAVAFIDELRASNKRIQELLNSKEIGSALADLSKSAANVRDITDSGKVSLKPVLQDLPAITARLKSSSERIDELLKDKRIDTLLTGAANTSDNAATAMADLRKLVKQLSTLLASQGQDIQAIISNLRGITENADAITSDAKENPSRLLFGKPPPPPPAKEPRK